MVFHMRLIFFRHVDAISYVNLMYKLTIKGFIIICANFSLRENKVIQTNSFKMFKKPHLKFLHTILLKL